MSDTITEGTFDGSTNVLSVPFPFIRNTHVQVTVGGIPVPAVDYTWSTPNTIALAASAASLSGKTWKLERVTPIDEPEVVFTAGGLDFNDLNRANLQLLYAAQEGADFAESLEQDDLDALRVPDGETVGRVPGVSERSSKLLAFDGNADPVAVPHVLNPTAVLSTQIADSTAVGRGLLTAVDELAGRVRLNVNEGRYLAAYHGAKGDGVTDDTTALLLCASENNGLVVGKRGAIYRTAGQFPVPADFDFDLNGGTWRPAYQGTDYAIKRSVSLGTSNAVASNVAGSRSVTLVAPVSDIVAGDWVMFNTTSHSGRWPSCPRRVTSITGGGAFVNVHTLIPWEFPPGTTMVRWVPSGDFAVRNGRFDCAQLLDPPGQECLGLMNVGGFEDVRLESLEFENYNINPASTDYIMYVQYANRVRCKDLSIEDAKGERGILTADRCGDVLDDNTFFDGDGFGVAGLNCESFTSRNMVARGRWTGSIASSKSVRAWRPIGCGTVRLEGAVVTGFDSAVKNEDNLSFDVVRLDAHHCYVGVNISHQNPHTGLGKVNVQSCRLFDMAQHGISDIDVVPSGHNYRDILIVRPGDHGVSFAGKDRYFDGITVRDWASGKCPIVGSTLSGVIPSGRISNVDARTTVTAGRLGVTIPTAATEMLLDDRSIVCNIPGASGGGYENRPPRVYEMPPGVILVGTAPVVFNTTADQPVTLTLPQGFTRYSLQAMIVFEDGAADVSSLTRGGIYTGPGKTGGVVVDNTQVYTNLTGLNTRQLLNVTSSGAQIMVTFTLYFSLTVANASAGAGRIAIYAYPQP